MKKISNLRRVFRPKNPERCGELYGKNGFNPIDRFEIARDDWRRDIQLSIEVFSTTKPGANGPPSMLLLTLEDAKQLHKELGRVLNPTKKDLENSNEI